MEAPISSGAPRVVALGGGHGLSASLRAIRRYAGSVTAVVSVADDGGSSGRLRAGIPGMPAPGDVRKCLGALAEEGTPFARILEHRFAAGAFEGHALGNLLLVALALELDSFSAAIDEVAERVGSVGRVLPATADAVALEGLGFTSAGDHAGEVRRAIGQVEVQNTAGLRRLRMQPPDAPSPPEVAEAILAADQVVLGPGSLFTSVLAAAIAPDVRQALAETSAQRVFVANLGPQVPETEGFTVADEVAALVAHGVAADVVVTDPIRPWRTELEGARCIVRSVANERGMAHDPVALAVALEELARTAGLLGSEPT